MGLSKAAGIKSSAIDEMIDAAVDSISHWAVVATANRVDAELVERIADQLPALAV